MANATDRSATPNWKRSCLATKWDPTLNLLGNSIGILAALFRHSVTNEAQCRYICEHLHSWLGNEDKMEYEAKEYSDCPRCWFENSDCRWNTNSKAKEECRDTRQEVCKEGSQNCASGYQLKSYNLNGVGKEFSFPGEGTLNCAKECNDRPGCTSYEYNYEGNFKCATYTGGEENVFRDEPQSEGWSTCVRNDKEYVWEQLKKFMDSEDVFERGQTQADIDAKAAAIQNFFKKYYPEYYYAIVVYKEKRGWNYHATDFDFHRWGFKGTNYVVSLSQTEVGNKCKTTKPKLTLDEMDIGCKVCDSPYTDCSIAENWIPRATNLFGNKHISIYARNYAEELKNELRKKGYRSCSVWPSGVDFYGHLSDIGVDEIWAQAVLNGEMMPRTQEPVAFKLISRGFGTCLGVSFCVDDIKRYTLFKERRYFCY